MDRSRDEVLLTSELNDDGAIFSSLNDFLGLKSFHTYSGEGESPGAGDGYGTGKITDCCVAWLTFFRPG